MLDTRRPIVVKVLHPRRTPPGERLDPQETREVDRKVTAAYGRMRMERPLPRPCPWHTPRYQ